MIIETYNQPINAEILALLLTADPDVTRINEYLIGSTILLAKEQDTVVGVAVLQSTNKQYELINIAVSEPHQGQGIAKSLIKKVKETAKLLGAESLIVGTGNSSLSQLALYQKCGFRMHHIEQDFFKHYPEAIYENGIRCIDKLVLRASLL